MNLGGVRVQRRYDATPAEVWAALTDPASLARWLAPTGRVELREGGSFELDFPGHGSRMSGRVRALAVTSAERNAQLPGIPALRETMPELASYDVSTWFGIFAPAGTPAPIIHSLNREIRALVEQPEMTARFSTMGGVAASGPVEEFAAFVAAETEKWRAVIRREGLQMDVG